MVFDIHRIEGDLQLSGDVPGIRQGIHRAAAVFLAQLLLTPQAEHDADHVIPPLLEKGSGHRAINASTHADNNAAFMITHLSLQLSGSLDDFRQEIHKAVHFIPGGILAQRDSQRTQGPIFLDP